MNAILKGELKTQREAKNVFQEYMKWETTQGLPSQPTPTLNSGLPFRDYRSFVLHVMFPPGDKENDNLRASLQPTTTGQSSRAGTIERTQSLRYFSQLLGGW
jgi:hypothetical protein